MIGLAALHVMRAGIAALAILSVGSALAQPPTPLAPDAALPGEAEAGAIGERLYNERCATCHEAGRAPPRDRIAANSPQQILEALDTGFMAAVAMFLTPAEKTLLATHLSETSRP
jgi:mono/diheme cytochrome c family protein